MVKFIKQDKAVSDVMGTILVVAITVLVASIIAAYAMGIPQKLLRGKQVAMTAEKSQGGTITITYHGGSDADKVVDIIVNVDETRDVCDGIITTVVGSSCEYFGIPNTMYHIVVIGKFSDGDQFVLYNEII